MIADRHAAGGLIGFPFLQQSLAMELYGRSGGMIHVGFDRPFKKGRSEAEKAKDVAIVGYDRPPGPRDLDELRKLRARGCYSSASAPGRAGAEGRRRRVRRLVRLRARRLGLFRPRPTPPPTPSAAGR